MRYHSSSSAQMKTKSQRSYRTVGGVPVEGDHSEQRSEVKEFQTSSSSSPMVTTQVKQVCTSAPIIKKEIKEYHMTSSTGAPTVTTEVKEVHTGSADKPVITREVKEYRTNAPGGPVGPITMQQSEKRTEFQEIKTSSSTGSVGTPMLTTNLTQIHTGTDVPMVTREVKEFQSTSTSGVPVLKTDVREYRTSSCGQPMTIQQSEKRTEFQEIKTSSSTGSVGTPMLTTNLTQIHTGTDVPMVTREVKEFQSTSTSGVPVLKTDVQEYRTSSCGQPMTIQQSEKKTEFREVRKTSTSGIVGTPMIQTNLKEIQTTSGSPMTVTHSESKEVKEVRTSTSGTGQPTIQTEMKEIKTSSTGAPSTVLRSETKIEVKETSGSAPAKILPIKVSTGQFDKLTGTNWPAWWCCIHSYESLSILLLH